MPIAQWTARGFQIKQWALILSPYEETMIMDTDIIACRDIDQWWEEMYPHSGGISLYSDYWRTNRSYDKHEGYCTGAFRGIKQSIDRREWIYPLYDRKAEEYDDESGVIFVNRKSINNEIPRFIAMTIAYSYYNSLFYGDKDLYHLAFGVYRAPIKPGSIVRLEDDKNMLIGMVQYTVSGQIGHIHLTIKPIRGNDTTSLISQEQMRITDGSLTTNLSPFISNNTVEFMVPTSQSIVLLPDRIYRLMETGYALSREYFLLSLF
jgi:hypothetical protein